MSHFKSVETMKKTIIILAAVAALFSNACNKSDILAPTDQRYIYMSYPESGNPVFNFSFVSTTKETVRIAVPIKFAGRPLTRDLAYALKAEPGKDPEKDTTMLAGTEFELPEPIFHQGNFLDTIFVTVHKTQRMDTMMCYLKINLVDNENFHATHTGALEAELRITAQIAQPAWWTQAVTTFYLGKYSDEKFALFTQEIFMGDYGELDESGKRFYALKFKYWLEAHPEQAKEKDGSPMTVAIQG